MRGQVWGERIKHQRWVGWTDRETGSKPQHKGEKKERKVVLLEGSKVEGNKIRGIIKARGWNLTGEQTRGC